MPVYDDQETKPKSVTDDDLRSMTGINKDQENAMDRQAHSGAAHDILNRERMAAAGKGGLIGKNKDGDKDSGGGLGAKAGAAAGLAGALGGSGDTRSSLDDKENDNFFKPKNDKPGGIKSRIRTKIAMASFISGLVGVGGGFGMFGYISGPLQFVHASKLLSSFHLDDKDDQVENRMMKMARYAREFRRGTPQNTRLGYMGVKIANRAETRFNANGFESTYGKLGVFRGYSIDPHLIKQGGVFDKLSMVERTPEGVRTFMEREYGITATVQGDKVLVDATQRGFNYRVNKRITYDIQRASGANRVVSAINTRFAGQRTGLGKLWHPIKRLDRRVQIALEDRYTAWVQRQKADVEAGSEPIDPAASRRQSDDPNNPTPDDGSQSEIERTVSDSRAAANDPAAMTEFKSRLSARLGTGAGIAGLVDIMCLLFYIFQNISTINRQHIEDPSMRFGMQMVSVGAQITTGIDLVGNTEQLGFFSRYMYNDTDHTSIFDAKSVRSEMGHTGGKEIPENMRVDPNNSLIARIFNNTNVFNAINSVCSVITSTLGTILLTGLSLLAALSGGFLVSFIVQTVASILIGPAVVDWIVGMLTGTELDVSKLAGADAGNVANYGTMFFGNNMAMAYGGRILSAAESSELRQSTLQDKLDEFHQQNLAYRLFNPYDPMSMMGKVIEAQKPDPSANVAMYATGLLNLGKSFGSILMSPFRTATVGAAPIIPYDYGQPEVAFSVPEMEDQNYESTVQNTDRAAALLDAGGPDLQKRIKVCTGDTVSQRPVNDPQAQDPNAQVWTVSAPRRGEQPLWRTFETGRITGDTTDYNCQDRSADWMTIRTFLIDNTAMNSYYCYDGELTDAVTEQACIDSGQDPEGTTVSADGTPADSTTTQTTGLSPTRSGQLAATAAQRYNHAIGLISGLTGRLLKHISGMPSTIVSGWPAVLFAPALTPKEVVHDN